MVKFKLFDASGKLLYSNILDKNLKSLKLNTSDLENGIYFYSISMEKILQQKEYQLFTNK
ncbi:MAG: T9SS type A sorting domain-containing protein [Saprospiraceae bacterium]